jgi:hypothetical protein
MARHCRSRTEETNIAKMHEPPPLVQDQRKEELGHRPRQSLRAWLLDLCLFFLLAMGGLLAAAVFLDLIIKVLPNNSLVYSAAVSLQLLAFGISIALSPLLVLRGPRKFFLDLAALFEAWHILRYRQRGLRKFLLELGFFFAFMAMSLFISTAVMAAFETARELVEKGFQNTPPQDFVPIVLPIVFVIFLKVLRKVAQRSLGDTYSPEERVQMATDSEALSVYKDVVEGRKREFSLFLRPFYSTKKLVVDSTVFAGGGGFTVTWVLEEQVANALVRFGPVIGLGTGGERFGSILAGEDEWQRAAATLIDHATRVVCVPSSHAGTLWEIDHIAAGGHLKKTVFVMPPRNPRTHRRLKKSELETDWAKLVIEMEKRDLYFPEFRSTLIFPISGLLFCPGTRDAKIRSRKFNMSISSIRKNIAELLGS